jgi:Tfp pilus assembly protein PilF
MTVAMQLCNEGKYEAALPYFDKVIAVDKKNDEAFRMKGQALMMLGRFNEATNNVIEALNINPQNIWTLILMGNIFAKQNDINGAMHYYEEAVKYHPNDAIAINNVAAAYMQQGMLDKALETFNRALAIDNSYPNTYYGKALILNKQGKEREAWEILMKAGTASMPRKENPNVIEEMNKFKMAIARKLAEGGDGYRAVDKVIKELEELGGIEIKTESVDSMSLSAKLEYAKVHGRKYHRIIYNESKKYHEHLILHELTHLRMAINASKVGKNEVPITDIDQVNAFHQRFAYFFNNLNVRIGEDGAKKVEKQIRNGLALQLYNCPLDLLVEDYIFNHYPEVRPVQLLSLFSQEEENINSVQQAEKAKVFPPAVVRANKLMNLVTSLHLEELYGINLQNYYKPTKAEFERAKDLYEEYKAYRDDYEPGEENELCRYFIETLGFDDLIVWVNEDVAHLDDDMIRKAKEAMLEVGADEIDERNKEFAENHKDGADATETMMMSMYMLEAMRRFDKMQHLEVRKVAMEIATVGITGINPNNKTGYRVPSFGDEDFGGYRLLAYYYVSFAREIPELLEKIGLPFSKAYEAALQLYNGGEK